jgi:hypothetical protein
MSQRTLPAQCIYVSRVIPTRIVIVSVTEGREIYVTSRVTNRCTFIDSLTWTLSAVRLHTAIQLDAMHNKKSGFGAVAMCHGGVITDVSNGGVTAPLITDVLKGAVSHCL